METISTKVRSLIEDNLKTDFELFEYKTSTIFQLKEDNVQEISSVLKNRNDLESGETYNYDSDTKEITLTASLSSGDEIKVTYTYYKYSDSELIGYIRSALVWISIYGDCETDFEIEDNDVEPTPENSESDLIAVIASILINPDWITKRLPNLTVIYPKTLSKQEKIKKIIRDFYKSPGIFNTLDWNVEN